MVILFYFIDSHLHSKWGNLIDYSCARLFIFQVSLNPVQILNQGAEEERAETARLVSTENILILWLVFLVLNYSPNVLKFFYVAANLLSSVYIFVLNHKSYKIAFDNCFLSHEARNLSNQMCWHTQRLMAYNHVD